MKRDMMQLLTFVKEVNEIQGTGHEGSHLSEQVSSQHSLGLWPQLKCCREDAGT